MRSLTFWENVLLGKEYFFRYNHIFSFPLKKKTDIRQYQFEKIKALIVLAYNQTEFYNKLYKKHHIHPNDIKAWKDFRKLPTITKDDIIANHETCIIKSKQNNKNLIISRSSGSSGKILDIISDGKSWIKQALITLRMSQMSYQSSPFDKQALIYTSEYPYRSFLGLYRNYYINTLTKSKKIMERLKKIRPHVINAYPSILLELITKFHKDCQKLQLKAITTNSEHTTQAQRDYISFVFNCPVFDEYSTEELALVGYQCKNKRYHLQEDCSYIEILDTHSDKTMKQGMLGEIVGTCLVNNVMPLIRYRQGDLGVIKKSYCSCKNNGRILSDIAGRKNASFQLAKGTIIPSGRILDWTYKLFLEFAIPIKQFQVIQKTKKKIEVVIIPDKLYLPKLHEKIIRRSFKKEFGEFLSIVVRVVKIIPRTPVGKHIPIKSLIRQYQ